LSAGATLCGAGGLRLVAREGALALGLVFAAAAILCSAAVVLLRLDALAFTSCLFKLFTGIACPSCGTTRALASLAALDLPRAFALNPLAALAAVALVAWGAADAVLLARGRSLRLEASGAAADWLRAAALAAIALNWGYLVLAAR
jgi:hypothetical protein